MESNSQEFQDKYFLHKKIKTALPEYSDDILFRTINICNEKIKSPSRRNRFINEFSKTLTKLSDSLTVLYAFIYIIIQLAEYSLLFGSIGLFVFLASYQVETIGMLLVLFFLNELLPHPLLTCKGKLVFQSLKKKKRRLSWDSLFI